MLTHPATETPARAVPGHCFALRTVLSADGMGRSLRSTHIPSPMETEACPSPHVQGCWGAEWCTGRPGAWMRGRFLLLSTTQPGVPSEPGGTSPQGGHFPHPVALLLPWSWGQMWHRGVLPWVAEEAQGFSRLH